MAGIGHDVNKIIKYFFENLLNEEVTAKIGSARFEQNKTRQGYRNRQYLRNLLIRSGSIPQCTG
ncbi:MAG: transposase [Candidatus Methanomethylicaceae archaeon]